MTLNAASRTIVPIITRLVFLACLHGIPQDYHYSTSIVIMFIFKKPIKYNLIVQCTCTPIASHVCFPILPKILDYW